MDVLAIDLGTSGVKVAVFDEAGVNRGSAATALTTRLTPDGGAEQDAEEWWVAVIRTARAALGAAGAPHRIGAIAVTSQFMSTVAVDPDGRPLSPVVMWMDHRGAPLHPVLDNGEAFFVWLDRHGLPPMSNDGLAHMALLRARDPELIGRGAVFVEPVDAIVARLTGRVTATQNSAFGLMAVDNRVHGQPGYDAELLELAGIDPAWLPPLVAMDEPLGSVTRDAAEQLGIPLGAVVLPGTIDSITSAVGTGAIGPDTVSIVIGTTSVLVSHVPDRRIDLDHALTSVPSPAGGQYFVMAENGVGGKALDHVLRTMVYGDDPLALGPFPPDAFERAEAAAGLAAPGCGGTLFVPWFVGSMSPAPDDDIRAGIVNMGLSTTRAELIRAVYEGVAANAAWLYPAVAALTGCTHASIGFGGGAARSALWGSMLADALGVEVRRFADPANTNARGAALLAQVQLGHLALADIPGLLQVQGVHEPDPARAAIAAARVAQLAEYHALTRAFHSGLPHP